MAELVNTTQVNILGKTINTETVKAKAIVGNNLFLNVNIFLLFCFDEASLLEAFLKT